MFNIFSDADTPVPTAASPPLNADAPPAEATDFASVIEAAIAVMAPLARRRGIQLSSAAVDGIATRDDPALLVLVISSALALIIRRARLGSVVTCILAFEEGHAVFRLWEEGHQQAFRPGSADLSRTLPHIGLDPLRRSYASVRRLVRQVNGTISLSDRSSHGPHGVLLTLTLATAGR